MINKIKNMIKSISKRTDQIKERKPMSLSTDYLKIQSWRRKKTGTEGLKKTYRK